MKASLLKWLVVAFALMLASSFVSMMATFVGSEGTDLRDLLVLQAALIPAALASVVWSVGLLVRQYGYRRAFARFRDLLPVWLLLAILTANALVLIAELSFVLIQHHTGVPRQWQEHLPAVAALFSSIALAACYVSFRDIHRKLSGSFRDIHRNSSRDE